MTVTRRRGSVEVGPPGGPSAKIPSGFSIKVRDAEHYDLDLDVAWDDTQGRLTLQRLVITAQPDGEYVRMSKISQIALAEVVATALERDVVGDHGWTQFVADHPDDDPVAVDALVYLISHALGGQKPSATVALARGLSPATGPKHVARARERGLIPPAEPGRSSGTGSWKTEELCCHTDLEGAQAVVPSRAGSTAWRDHQGHCHACHWRPRAMSATVRAKDQLRLESETR